MEYRNRTYRNRISKGSLTAFPVTVRETDLFICTDNNCTELAYQSVRRHRGYVEEYINHHPSFAVSMTPVPIDPFAPVVIREMIDASARCGVGPMASVAGAIARYVGLDLMEYSENIIIENGGDVFLRLIDRDEVTFGIFAGSSPLSDKVFLRVRLHDKPLGVCTSSGTVGHSKSFGAADAVCVRSDSSTLADAAATAIGNCVKREGDITGALDYGMGIQGVQGVVIIVGDKLGIQGDMELA